MQKFQEISTLLLLLWVGSLLDLDSGLPRDDTHINHVHEQAMVDDALEREDGLGGGMAVLDRGLEVEVDDEVVVVGHIGLVTIHAQLGLTPSHLRGRSGLRSPSCM